MDDFIALLMAVAASAASVMLMKLGAAGFDLLGAPQAVAALGPAAQAVAGLGVGILTFRKVTRVDGDRPAL